MLRRKRLSRGDSILTAAASGAVGLGLELLESRRMMALVAGDLDITFGPGGTDGIDGVVTTPTGDLVAANANDVAVDTDGSVVAAGWTFSGGFQRSTLVRYLANGNLDPAFGTGGVLTLGIGTSFDTIEAVDIVGGKIIAAGVADGTDVFVMKLNADGTPDIDFNSAPLSEGIYIVPAFSGDVTDMAVRSNGQVVVGGNSAGLGYVIQFTNPAGPGDVTLDVGWGGDGIADVNLGLNTHLSAIALQTVGPDQYVIVGGEATNVDGDVAVARLDLTGGTLDGTFGDGGGVGFADTAIVETVSGIGIDSAGRIYASVQHTEAVDGVLSVYRFTAGGTFDTAGWHSASNVDAAPGEAQIAITDTSFSTNDIAIDSAGRPVVTGFAFDSIMGTVSVATARFNAAGEPDATFGTTGALTLTTITGGDAGNGLKITADGHIVVAGSTATDFAALRYGAAVVVPPPTPVFVDGSGNLVIPGTGGNDIFVITPAPGGAHVVYNGSDAGNFVFSGSIVSDGAAGNDLISVAPSITAKASLTGGAGNDTLIGGAGDDSLLGGADNDDLFGNIGNDVALGDTGNDYVSGGAGIDALGGGDGADIVNGDAGVDLIGGGSGRDLLIGGDNEDLILGNNDDDIMIGGTVTLSQSDQRTVLAEWNGPGTYAQRVAAISGGTGVNLVDGVTVFDDGDIDILVGGVGTDWFLVNLDGSLLARDVILDRLPSEIRTDID